MKLTKLQIERAARHIIEEWKKQKLVTFKVAEEKVLKRAQQLLDEEFQKERDLDREVLRMIDELERNNAGEFDRHKMFPLLKKRLAKEKGIVL